MPVDDPGGGAPLSLGVLYRRHFPMVCRWAAALGGGAAGLDPRDIAQEVFLVVQRRLAEFEGEDPTSWLYAITVRVIRSARRRAWFRRVLLGAVDAGVLEELADPGLTPYEEVERRQRQRTAQALLARLSEKRRTAFALFELMGCSAEEIARLEGIPAATVRTRVFEARRDFIRLAAQHRRRSERSPDRPGSKR